MIAVCTEFDELGACTETVWMPFSGGGLPALSVADAQEIGLAFALLWGIAWGFRMMKRALDL